MGQVTESDSLDELKEVTGNLKKIMSSSSSSFNLPSSSSSSSSSYRQFSLSEIKEVTNNFDKENILRRGPFWIEYLADIYLDSKTKKTRATVKHLKKNCTDEFEKEIRTATKIQAHPNVISLLGYCIESGEKILIYTYMENGCLIDYVKMDSRICLSWKQRLNICLGAAYGLKHLHKEEDEFHNAIYCGDLKLSNILLDSKGVAKVSYFGLTHSAKISSNFNSMPSGYLTRKQDVYAFGLILFQVLCRKMLMWEQEGQCGFETGAKGYACWAIENVDMEIREDISSDSLHAFTDSIGRCLDPIPYRRPSMDRVVLDLEAALKCQEDEGEPIDSTASGRNESRTTEGVTKPSSSFSLSSSSCRKFSLDEIKEATNNFDVKKRLGHGGEGTVYLAEIYLDSETEKSTVAVKHLDKDLTGEFEKEIVTMTKIQHPNIVSLLGYCNKSDYKVLIYEFMRNGSLYEYVKMDSTKDCLSWKKRLNICLGAARGLQHLHKETKEFPKGIIHRDVKPENILIDENWVAKVSDFGMFKLSNVDQTNSTIISVHAKGTPGYIAPECVLSDQLSRKIDVYAFGLVMYEVLCRKKRWGGEDVSIYLEENEDLERLAYENVDTEIRSQISDNSLGVFIDIIASSLRRDPKRRPTMDEVVLNLEAVRKYQLKG